MDILGHNKKSRFPSGFTLIELVLLTVIIAILVAVSTPQFGRTFSNLVLKDASFNMARLISFAQEKAILEGTPYKLVLDTEKARYYLTRLDPAGSGKYVRIKKRHGRVFRLPRRIRLEADKDNIIFFPDGRSEKAAITLFGGKKGLSLKVSGRLGYVDIKNASQ